MISELERIIITSDVEVMNKNDKKIPPNKFAKEFSKNRVVKN
jgi:hypothetical protein